MLILKWQLRLCFNVEMLLIYSHFWSKEYSFFICKMCSLQPHWIAHNKFLGHILRMEKDEPINIYALFEPPMGKEHQGDPFLTRSRNGLTLISISKMMTSCALLKTEPVGDALQLTALLQSSNDDDDDDEVSGNIVINSISLRKHPFLLALCRWRRFLFLHTKRPQWRRVRRNGCFRRL